MKVGNRIVDVSVSKTLFFGCAEKYTYMATHHPFTQSEVYSHQTGVTKTFHF